MNLETWEVALRKGLGRALQHVAEMDVAAVRPLILEACLRDISYDHQMEDRARWMAEMLLRSGDLEDLLPRIVAGLDELQDYFDANQCLEILAHLVLAGHEELRPVVYSAFRAIHRKREIQSDAGRDALRLMDGAAALLPVAQVAGERLLADPDEWEDEGFFGSMEPPLSEMEVHSRLADAARTDARIAELLSRIEVTRKRRLENRPRRVSPSRAELDALVSDTRRQEDLRLVPLTIPGRSMSHGDAVFFLRRLDAETDPAILERILWLLRSRPHPEVSDRVLELARSPRPEVQRTALDLLERSGDRRGPPVARELLRTDPSAIHRGAVGVLGKACAADDAPVILQVLDTEARVLVDADDVQSVVHDLLTLRGAVAGPRLADVFAWVYEHAFCGHCRGEAVEALVEMSALDAQRREECRFDAVDDVRAAAR